MKKFLSLVLALVMTMSLVTISAGATEYKDLKDKSEITYEEAVAVMNKIGIISGYEDGTFKPTATLTRGAAAKIITYMMLGTVAAEQLGVAGKPYKDVALDNTFAPYIAYCKSTGLINGYSDGTFRPGAPLDGYSFSKMLLTALGYSSEYEGFIGSGWQTNVASIAVKTGLYAGKDAFVGSATVTREEACLYAFNTLQATEVEYAGIDISVTSKDTNVQIGNSTASWVTNDKQASLDKTYNNVRDGYTQFCEEHFSALKLINDGTASDDFGRPSNKWAFKKATIGTYPLAADFTFTADLGDSGKDEAYNAKQLGLKGYDYAGAGVNPVINGRNSTRISTLKALALLTANGTAVEVFTDADAANTITDVVVIKTQLMKVDKISTTAVSLKKIEDDNDFFKVNPVKADDGNYAALSALKVGDYVLTTPVAGANGIYDVAAVAMPTTATGNITKITTKNMNVAIGGDQNRVTGITLAGTEYGMSALWTAEDGATNLASTSVSVKKDSTAYVDAFGYVIYVKNVTASTSYIVYADTYSNIVDGKIHYFANGYDMSGNALSLDFGTAGLPAVMTRSPGSVFAYRSATANSAEYTLDTAAQNAKVNTITGATIIRPGQLHVNNVTVASDVKFLFITRDSDGNVTGVTVKDGVQEVKGTGTGVAGIQYVLNKDNNVASVIIPNDNDVEVSKNVLYVSKETGTTKDAAGKTVSVFTAYIDGQETKGCVSTKRNAVGDQFYTYATDANGIYTLNSHSNTYDENRTTSVLSGVVLSADNIINKAYINNLTIGGTATAVSLNAKNANVIDLTGGLEDFRSVKDLKEAGYANYTISLLYNNGQTSAKGTVAYIYVLNTKGVPAAGGSTGVAADAATMNYMATALNNGTVRVSLVDCKRDASFVPANAALTVGYDIYLNGSWSGSDSTVIAANQTTKNEVSDNIGAVAGDVVTIKLTSVKPSLVKVLYVDAAGNDISKQVFADATFKTAAPATISTTAAVDNNGDATVALTFYVKTTDVTTELTATVMNTVENADGVDTDVVAGTAAYTKASVKFEVKTDAKTPAGNSAVTIAVTGLDNLKYTVTGFTATALSTLDKTYAGDSTALKLAITTSNANVGAGGKVNLTATLEAIGAAKKAVKVIITDGTTDYVLYFGNTAAAVSLTETVTVNSNLTYTVLSVTDVTAPTVTDVVLNDIDKSGDISANDTITFTFSEKVTVTTGNPTLSATGMTVAGNGGLDKDTASTTYTITVGGNPTAAGTLTFAVNTITSVDTKASNAATIAFTVPEDGIKIVKA